MSSSNFTFPPPPPPPPVAAVQDLSTPSSYNVSSRGGRGSGRAYDRGRGRGGNPRRLSRGNNRGSGYGRRQGADDRFSQFNQHDAYSSGTQPSLPPLKPGYGQASYGHSQNQQWLKPQVYGSQMSTIGYSNGQAGAALGQPFARPASKRNYAEAFSPNRSNATKMATAPAVPSFGDPIPTIPAPGPVPNRNNTEKKKLHNQLGLTPRTEDYESSGGEDENEEAKLASGLDSSSNGQAIQISYKGRSLKLSSQAEIDAWIQERKRRYPTKAKIEEAKAMKEKAKEQRNDTKTRGKQRNFPRETRGPQKATDPQGRSTGPRARTFHEKPSGALEESAAGSRGMPSEDKVQDEAAKVRSKAARLRKKLEKAQKKLEAIEGRDKAPASQFLKQSSTRTSENTDVSLTGQSGQLANNENLKGTLPISPSQQVHSEVSDHSSDEDEPTSSDDSDDTCSDALSGELQDSDEDSSSNDSSDGESDTAPLELSSKEAVQEQTEPISPQRKKATPPAICRDFKTRGRCPRGRGCRFRHERPKRQESNEAPGTQRVTLYQRLLARQQEEEDEKLLQLIVKLGDNGYLDEPEERAPAQATTNRK